MPSAASSANPAEVLASMVPARTRSSDDVARSGRARRASGSHAVCQHPAALAQMSRDLGVPQQRDRCTIKVLHDRRRYVPMRHEIDGIRTIGTNLDLARNGLRGAPENPAEDGFRLTGRAGSRCGCHDAASGNSDANADYCAEALATIARTALNRPPTARRLRIFPHAREISDAGTPEVPAPFTHRR